jgi:hypothetical protein
MPTLEDVERIMVELPEVVEGEHHGHATWSVRGKGIAWLRPFSKADLKRFGDRTPPAAPILAVTTKDLHDKAGVLAADIDGVFTIEHFPRGSSRTGRRVRRLTPGLQSGFAAVTASGVARCPGGARWVPGRHGVRPRRAGG